MKFEARRTSIWSQDEDPHFPGAYAESCLRTYGGEMGHVQRWFVDVDTVEQLVELATDRGLIIGSGDELPSLEIYDDWRE